ncbi:MAG: hypothetical protein A2X17_01720 [Bacteroidetes bacterium GWF2_41_61]|nr:MAG: hypothetical protein A2X20_07375 [Bacteroidetes bacterium GWE2_40_15]OFY25729.1 MAG: hypothetical protein A2X17_01720 [Bacteroidetes bacterium GWF2_41_61]OFY91280.1 MAG: hypothetical protein A2266_04990 [Bacteroidetes bacterium RIFOXYA12_FULL_40_10]HBG24023.1 hypothetical protein [Rikenellaceae bacterium]HBZ25733.1 hypothetical protein [Rikenellaceae bacterium]
MLLKLGESACLRRAIYKYFSIIICLVQIFNNFALYMQRQISIIQSLLLLGLYKSGGASVVH